jgi:Na+-transporting NADH:ubiquinone oxidoreductase subunit A
MRIRIRDGLDVPVDGKPDGVIDSPRGVRSVALLGADYVGLEPRMRVEVGDQVATGDPLFEHKRDPDVVFTAPASGRISAIQRGARRVLKSVVIDLEADRGVEVDSPVSVAEHGLREALLKSGLWTAFRTRPFSRVPDSRAQPAAIFVTALDTHPLAANPNQVIAEYQEAFSQGLSALTDLMDTGNVYLCTGADWSGPSGEGPSIRHVVFEGPHPAGLPGTHIHHLDPAGPSRSVWHIGYQDVIAIGKLVGEGRLWLERIVALGGNGFQHPRLVRTRLGAAISDLTASELVGESPDGPEPRIFSGSVLSGREAVGSEAYLGRFHTQICALQEPEKGRRLRWRRLIDGRFSFAGTFASASGGKTKVPFTTDQNGRATALVPLDAFERLIPMDVLAEPLLRALLIGDTDQAQALGALELDEEDLALCSFVCPGKNDYGAVLRANLARIEREG